MPKRLPILDMSALSYIIGAELIYLIYAVHKVIILIDEFRNRKLLNWCSAERGSRSLCIYSAKGRSSSRSYNSRIAVRDSTYK